jgi:4-hydroxy-tetrahydrodipicolinate synthase
MFHGSIVALVTPMSEDGRVDYAALERLIDFHIEQGSNGIVSVGTTGESATLDMDEHIDVVARTVRHARGRLPILAGTGGNSTWEAIALTQRAREAGADACLLVVPYYNKPTQEGLYRHFRAIAEAVDVPQILYNVPGRTCCDMLNDTVVRLAQVDRIIGLKDATGDLGRVRDLRERCGAGFVLLSGDDFTTREFTLLGGDGAISVTANVAPAQMARMCAAARAGDAEGAAAIDAEIASLHKALFVEANPIPVKWALREMGLIGPGIRLPLTPLSERFHPAVRAALEHAGIMTPPRAAAGS